MPAGRAAGVKSHGMSLTVPLIAEARVRAKTFPTDEEIRFVAEDLGVELLGKIRAADRTRVWRVVADPIFTGERRENRRYTAVPTTKEFAALVAAMLR